MCHTNPRFIKEVEDRIGDSLIEEIIGEVPGLSIDLAMKEIEDMDVVEVAIGEVVFTQEVTFKVDITAIEWIGIGKIGEYGGNPDPEKEKEIDKVDHHLVLGQDQGLVQIEIGLDVLGVESMTILLMNALIWFLIIQIGKVIVQGWYHCIWPIVIQDRTWNNI